MPISDSYTFISIRCHLSQKFIDNNGHNYATKSLPVNSSSTLTVYFAIGDLFNGNDVHNVNVDLKTRNSTKRTINGLDNVIVNNVQGE